MIDEHGFRPNVGIILANCRGDLLWARRRGQSAWQFPQGGIHEGESPEDAMYRELGEEVGLAADDVELLDCTGGWLHYRLPPQFMRNRKNPNFVGQKQKWFLLRLVSNDERVRVDAHPSPEFDQWRWVSYWYPLGQIVAFKREVYRRALWELAPRHGRLVRNGR
ncbi:MAG: RNA pyrophosphohydrolase [Pseudomonadales bacterium]|nr:RNA pyrophosphohydrolase [Pseudomonadales bacterium]